MQVWKDYLDKAKTQHPVRIRLIQSIAGSDMMRYDPKKFQYN